MIFLRFHPRVGFHPRVLLCFDPSVFLCFHRWVFLCFHPRVFLCFHERAGVPPRALLCFCPRVGFHPRVFLCFHPRVLLCFHPRVCLCFHPRVCLCFHPRVCICLDGLRWQGRVWLRRGRRLRLRRLLDRIVREGHKQTPCQALWDYAVEVPHHPTSLRYCPQLQDSERLTLAI